MKQACPKRSKAKASGGHDQIGAHGRGREGRRSSNNAYLVIADDTSDTNPVDADMVLSGDQKCFK
jgi:hypothetical protein